MVLRARRGFPVWVRQWRVRSGSGPPRKRGGQLQSLRSKKVRAKASTSPQKETSESERWEEARAFGAGVGKRARRFATNWDGTGVAKWADLSLVSYLKAI